MTVLLLPFLVLAVVGLVLSLAVHVVALFGQQQPLGEAVWALHIGIFVVCLPAMLVSYRLVKEFKYKDMWRAALRGCPPWMRRLTAAFGVYAAVNFVIFAALAPPGEAGRVVNAPPIVLRGFSGHWMVFYSAAAAMFYSAVVVAKRDPARRCPNGHPVSPSAVFCEVCGSRVADLA